MGVGGCVGVDDAVCAAGGGPVDFDVAFAALWGAAARSFSTGFWIGIFSVVASIFLTMGSVRSMAST